MRTTERNGHEIVHGDYPWPHGTVLVVHHQSWCTRCFTGTTEFPSVNDTFGLNACRSASGVADLSTKQ